MLDFIVRWSEKAKSLLRANIIWNSSSHLQEQIRLCQVIQVFLISWRGFERDHFHKVLLMTVSYFGL